MNKKIKSLLKKLDYFMDLNGDFILVILLILLVIAFRK